ncbi:MAG: fumarylacetoacetate hydrolase family protein [Phycisphaerales bacterium]|nr:fumarylacetoacetate hydrolase family protein [Phycisphaerales bacterium]
MKILCIGRNYVEHAIELNNRVPEEPIIFLKPATALNTTRIFHLPTFSQDIHYEVEIVLCIGRVGKAIPKEDALSYVDSLTLGIDFTARDIQTTLKSKGLPWEKAKAFDGSAVIGKKIPFHSMADRLSSINFSLLKNGATVQSGNTGLMLFDFATIVSFCSIYFTLEVGDLIFTGTPSGVGSCKHNDQLTGTIEGHDFFNIAVLDGSNSL